MNTNQLDAATIVLTLGCHTFDTHGLNLTIQRTKSVVVKLVFDRTVHVCSRKLCETKISQADIPSKIINEIQTDLDSICQRGGQSYYDEYVYLLHSVEHSDNGTMIRYVKVLIPINHLTYE